MSYIEDRAMARWGRGLWRGEEEDGPGPPRDCAFPLSFVNISFVTSRLAELGRKQGSPTMAARRRGASWKSS